MPDLPQQQREDPLVLASRFALGGLIAVALSLGGGILFWGFMGAFPPIAPWGAATAVLVLGIGLGVTRWGDQFAQGFGSVLKGLFEVL